ncbi:hypothetical protein BRADI_3g45424v3 [Brachypodium distachyon]|uniref:Uncharacterized protein n=1 Tax=Brachypodium distachyon TaxID=15368 RepID=A0A2K2D3E5_BRADI|nr:hypothetical protein BRADI_3g45424v3 [Brachypodium distachyon]
MSKCQSSTEVLLLIFSLDQEQLIMAVALLWCWCNERNKANRQEQICFDGGFSIYTLRFHVNEWLYPLVRQKVLAVPVRQSGKPPPVDFVKINLDGSFDQITSSGDVIFAAARPIPIIASAFRASATFVNIRC